MSLAGVRTNNISAHVGLSDEVVVNRERSTGLQRISDLAMQLASLTPLNLGGHQAPLFPTAEALSAAALASKVSAWVYDDPDADNNGIWTWDGAEWQWALPLPYSFIPAAATGGTASAIEATTQIPVNASSLILLTVAEDYEGAAATVSFNASPPLNIKASSGDDVTHLAGGSIIYGMISGADFRLANDDAIARLIYEARDDALAAKVAAEIARNIAAGFAADLVSQGNVPVFDSRDTVEAYDLSALSVVRLNRYASSSIVAPATYVAVDAEPPHAAKFQSPPGKWWELRERVPAATMLGAAIDGATDDTQAYRDFADFIVAAGVSVADLGSGVARCSKALSLPPITYVGGSVTFDFSSVSSDAEFPTKACLEIIGSAPVALPPLASDPVAGGYQLTLSDPPDLEPGNLICIYNPIEYSFNGYRFYYKAGEWCRVLDVSGTTVSLVAPLAAGYSAAAVDLYKCGDDSVVFAGGRLRVRASQSVLYGARMRRLQRSVFDMLDVHGAADTEIQWYECVDCVGRGIETGKAGLILSSYYGGYVANCQGMRLDGNWRGGRHGITLTGTGLEGHITPPTRDIQIAGEYWNMRNADDAYHSFNAHGNAIGYSASGIFHNGASLGGNKGRIAGRIETYRDNDFGAIAFLEQHGTDFSVDADIYTQANPSNKSRGVIDIGGNSEAITDKTVMGGYYRFRGTLHAPLASRILRMRNRGAVGLKIGVDLSGLKVAEAAASGSSTSVQVDAVSGDAINELDLTGFRLPDGHGWSVDTVTRISGWRQTIKTSIDTTTDVSTVSKAIPVNAPKIPCVALTLGDGSPGGTPDATVAFNGGLLSRTAINVILAAAAGNFPAAETVPVHVALSVDE